MDATCQETSQLANRQREGNYFSSLTIPSRGPLEVHLEATKERLLKLALAGIEDPTLVRALRSAANEAAALAWYTGYPTLILPGLLDEKIQTALKRWKRQEQLLQL